MAKFTDIFIRLPKYKGKGCTACMECKNVCPTKSIEIEEKGKPRPIFNYGSCVSTFNCVESCPENVIHKRKLRYRDLIFLSLITIALLIAAIVFAV